MFTQPFELATRPVTNGEYLEFVEGGGYRDPQAWLSDGWDWVAAAGIRDAQTMANKADKWDQNTGGKFYRLNDISRLTAGLSTEEVKSLIHSEESFHPLINLKAVFFLLLVLISIEWFLRKYFGSY